MKITAENFSSDEFDAFDDDDFSVRGISDDDDDDDDDVGDVDDAGNFGVKDSQPDVGLVEARQVGHLKGKSDKESEKDPVRVRRAPGSEFQMSPSRLL